MESGEWQWEKRLPEAGCKRWHSGTLVAAAADRSTNALTYVLCVLVCVCVPVCVCVGHAVMITLTYVHRFVTVCVCSFVAQRKYHIVTKQLPLGKSCSACWAYTQ